MQVLDRRHLRVAAATLTIAAVGCVHGVDLDAQGATTKAGEPPGP